MTKSKALKTNWAYFDDFKITHTKTNVVQHNEYYPFGLQTDEDGDPIPTKAVHTTRTLILRYVARPLSSFGNGGGSSDQKPAEYGLGFQLSVGLGLTKGTELSIGGWSGGPGSRGQIFFSLGTATRTVYLNAGASAQLELLRSRSGTIDVSGKGKSWSVGAGDFSGAYSQGFDNKGNVSVDVIGAGLGLGFPVSVGVGVETKTWTMDIWTPMLFTLLTKF